MYKGKTIVRSRFVAKVIMVNRMFNFQKEGSKGETYMKLDLPKGRKYRKENMVNTISTIKKIPVLQCIKRCNKCKGFNLFGKSLRYWFQFFLQTSEMIKGKELKNTRK